MSSTFQIARLGAQGDGVADTEKGQVFIPFALPGETVTAARIKDRADLVAVLGSSPQRVAPACRHFTVCGGCAVQHLEHSAYRDWKRRKVAQALHAARIDAAVDEIVPCAPETRRRVTFSARKTERGAVLGFHRALSKEIVDIEECPISLPEIVAALPKLGALATAMSATRDAFHMTSPPPPPGLDIAAQGSGAMPDAQRRAVAELSSGPVSRGFPSTARLSSSRASRS